MGLNSFQTSGNSPGACRVGILGFGTIGAAVARRLAGADPHPQLLLTHICDRRAREKRARQPQSVAACTWTDSFDDLLASDVDVIVEAIAGAEPAVDYVRAALLTGKSVVTANRQLIARQGAALLTIAERQGRQLRFEGAVGGAMPIVRALGEGLTGDRVERIDAILNGTANAVLSRMDETGCPMNEAIADACASGYADEDPSVDLDGVDAAAKLAILCALGFAVKVSPTDIDTRTTLAVTPQDFAEVRDRGITIRPVAHAEYDRSSRTLTAWVAPIAVRRSSIFGRTEGPQNAAVIRCAHAGEITLSGIGAGGDATAVAVISDLVTISRDRAAIVPAPVLAEPAALDGFSERKVTSLREAV